MKKTVLFIIAILMLPSLLLAAPNQADSQQLIGQIQSKAVATTNLQADFARTSDYVAIGNDGASQVMGTGKLYWAAPLNLRLEQVEPSSELIVSDGASVWWVRPERNRADAYPVDNFTSSLRSVLDILGGLSGINDNFIVEPTLETDLSPDNSDITLVLRPKVARADLNRLVLWFNQDTLQLAGFRFSNVVGDVTQYRFSNVLTNQSLPKDFFKYSPPADYRVNDQRGQK